MILFFLFFNCSANQAGQEVKKINGKDYSVYNVQAGDGWFGIARKFNISSSELRLANKESDKLAPGQKISIPK